MDSLTLSAKIQFAASSCALRSAYLPCFIPARLTQFEKTGYFEQHKQMESFAAAMKMCAAGANTIQRADRLDRIPGSVPSSRRRMLALCRIKIPTAITKAQAAKALEWVVHQMAGGSAAAAASEPADTRLLPKATRRNTPRATSTAGGDIAARLPAAVATPFPPFFIFM
jgi:hypothetical protein